uniref:Uncharacterized protein n=1 Tax=Candidatus Kentrum sp. MB TaxID=2138164 RepID=A0A451BGB0_9GAMM|nr:MAG: hypothetical protein BECKMB1821I_GA0114274_10362 [Candidatus Kentron sp. MB]VFK77302.1 MAG: hypothetical protein BECKMB1821H_GA0114242_11212 [Candidatus Kentron sp. MB]
MNIRLTKQESIRVINGEDVFAIMQKVLLRENKIDRDKEHFRIVGLDADSRILFIALVVLGGVTSVTVKPMETFRVVAGREEGREMGKGRGRKKVGGKVRMREKKGKVLKWPGQRWPKEWRLI